MEKTAKDYQDSIKEYSNNLLLELQSGGSENFKAYLKMASKFHKYSMNNQMLILIQNSSAKKVASFKKWQELGRSVKKGEKAIRILAPVARKMEVVRDGQAEEVSKIFGFKAVPVFDISQTEGQDLPEWSVRTICGDNDLGLYDLLKSKIEASGIIVEETISGTLGVSYGGRIEINVVDQDQVSKFLTLVHEQAHEILHKGSESRLLSKNDKECQAEATAYIVASHFGLESTVSSEYLMCWGNYGEEFSKNLSAVVKASEEILNMIGSDTVSNNSNQEESVQAA